MVRNRELLFYVLAAAAVAALFTALGSLQSAACALTVLGALLATGVCTAVLLAVRYRRIAALSVYLKQVADGREPIDIRDSREGELSILKSEIYKVTGMLSEQASRLEREKRSQADALADISHQLKTPVTSMMVMTDLLSQGTLDDDKRAEFTRDMRAQLERLRWLITALLKLSRLDAGVVEFERRNVRCGKLIAAAVAPLAIAMELREQTLCVAGEDVVVCADREWTTEALMNLVKNCVEHTQNGGRIEIACEQNPLFVSITVRDNGEGIAREDLPHLFRRFYRGKNAGADSVGIGLAMAEQILRGQDASLSVKSEVGRGTEFSIKFHRSGM
ncbi:sensor histidine kinase [Feifania hominis]|uniref:histidine kinase n=1 Tax=Feifania hominis TaxID=2763660 RepID=A0A926HW03_9FIRM|nr:HAMP domain-containing sensor histidine kinase [Feifania hominis]MBC8537186.1 HAMP domain-containing histidine kinase [Feifania hominis]